MRKAALGLIARGSQGLLLAAAVPLLPAEESSDIAVVLAITVAVNLMTNVGIPTLIVRGWRQGAPVEYLVDLVRAYLCFSFLGSIIAALVLLPLTSNWAFGALGGGLCMVQSAYYGLEYWELGRGNQAYDRFLRKPAAIQAFASLLGPLLLFLTKDPLIGLLGLLLSFLLGILFHAPSWRPTVWISLGGQSYWREWWAAAVGIGAGTLFIAALYSADAVALKLVSSSHLVGSYRLALMVIAFAVALIPVNIFVLADVAGGARIRYRGLVALAISTAALSVIAGAILPWLSEDYRLASMCLLVLSPLAAIRLLTQVSISDLNARGKQLWVAGVFACGLAGWVGIALGAARWGAHPLVIGMAQVALELLLLVALRAENIAASAKSAQAARLAD